MMFTPPASWSDERRSFARQFLFEAQKIISLRETKLRHGFEDRRHWNGSLPDAGPGLAHGRVLTVDEANGHMPCDVEFLKTMTDEAFRGITNLFGQAQRLTLVVVNVQVLHRGPFESTPSDDEFVALDSALDAFFGDISTRGDGWITAWTNIYPTAYDEWLRKSPPDELCHNASRPPVTTLRDYWNAEEGARHTQQFDLTRDIYSGKKCVSLVDIDVDEDVGSVLQAHADEDRSQAEKFSGNYRFLDSPVTAKCHTGSLRCETATFKLNTTLSARRDARDLISKGILFVPLVPGVFDLSLHCFIPGLN